MFVGMPIFLFCTHFGYAFKYHAFLVSARRVECRAKLCDLSTLKTHPSRRRFYKLSDPVYARQQTMFKLEVMISIAATAPC